MDYEEEYKKLKAKYELLLTFTRFEKEDCKNCKKYKRTGCPECVDKWCEAKIDEMRAKLDYKYTDNGIDFYFGSMDH